MPRQLGADVWLITGGFAPGRQPDGNSVVLEGPHGLIVVDTGRHAFHREKIEAFAEARGRPVAAIVNTHWHLDHVSGNPALKSKYPGARVYSTRAIEAAIPGFLRPSAEQGRQFLASGEAAPEMAEDVRGDIATIEAAERLLPDVPVERSNSRKLAGRRLDLRLARHAATAADLWLYDPKSRVLVAGDLVTLPIPFLDTACPEGWRSALREISSVDFRVLVPGHGSVMARPQFELYRTAFADFIDCAAGTADKRLCADRWVAAVSPLLGIGEAEKQRARSMAIYYVGDVLRANGGKSEHCDA
jgi:glyoxylase-like metal-dependent hydrolase (beta-lactamase superfamily II)